MYVCNQDRYLSMNEYLVFNKSSLSNILSSPGRHCVYCSRQATTFITACSILRQCGNDIPVGTQGRV